ATFGCNGCHRRVSRLLQATIARGDGAVPVGDTNHGLVEVLLGVAQGIAHRTVGGAFGPLRDVRRAQTTFFLRHEGLFESSLKSFYSRIRKPCHISATCVQRSIRRESARAGWPPLPRCVPPLANPIPFCAC